ncbi:MAG: CAP domain-containing protein [Puniceicoccaceae bacterium]|nr:MAG: CAP domain-containing protein [Puniceicoccaceae bacterium]
MTDNHRELSLLAAALFAPVCWAAGAEIVPNALELELAELIRNHPGQQRPEMIHNPILHQVARAKVEDLGRRDYWSHTDPDGYGPNVTAALAGYTLPESWLDRNNRNQIEALAAGYHTAQRALEGWLASDSHRRHVLGESDFHRTQTHYGVGFARVPGSTYVRYFAFISAPPDPREAILEPYTVWLFAHFTPREIDLYGHDHDITGNGVPRLVAFALDQNPHAGAGLPSPRLHPVTRWMEWTLPLREDLGAVDVRVERALHPTGPWMTSRVFRTGNTFTLPTVDGAGYLRLRVERLMK